MVIEDKPKKIKDLLQEFDLNKRQRYVRKEYQAYGLQLANELNDWKNRSLYIKLAKQLPYSLLEKTRLFVKDQSPNKIRNKAKLFMWKLKQFKEEIKK